MIATFSSAEHDPSRRGDALGRAFRDRLAANWDGYEQLFRIAGATGDGLRAAGERALERIGDWAPALADEIAGVASGSGLERWRLGALNARTEVLAGLAASGRGECSTFVAVPPRPTGDPPVTIQTWDWHDHLRDGMLAARLEPRPGHAVALFTELGVVGKVGVNSAGLGLHFNILAHASDGGPIGVPVHAVARRILDEAGSVEEATAIARSAAVSASTVLTVVDYDGTRSRARCLELSPAGLAELEPDADGVLVHANHFLDPALARGERHGPLDPGSYGRLAELARRAPELRAAADPAARAALLRDHRDASPLCCHPLPDAPRGERWRTLATIALDPAAGRIHVHDGGPCTAGAGAWTTV